MTIKKKIFGSEKKQEHQVQESSTMQKFVKESSIESTREFLKKERTSSTYDELSQALDNELQLLEAQMGAGTKSSTSTLESKQSKSIMMSETRDSEGNIHLSTTRTHESHLDDDGHVTSSRSHSVDKEIINNNNVTGKIDRETWHKLITDTEDPQYRIPEESDQVDFYVEKSMEVMESQRLAYENSIPATMKVTEVTVELEPVLPEDLVQDQVIYEELVDAKTLSEAFLQEERYDQVEKASTYDMGEAEIVQESIIVEETSFTTVRDFQEEHSIYEEITQEIVVSTIELGRRREVFSIVHN